MGQAERCILHADMDAFYAAIEQRDRPELRGRPVVVGGLGHRGVVSTCSYEARRFGVHSAMPTAVARRLAPDAHYLVPRMTHYAEVSRRVMAIFRDFTPLVEPLSLDEAFLDVGGSRALFGPGPKIAARIRERVREELNLTISIGVAPNKFLAKLASDLEKPDALVVVPEDIEGFLAPLEIKRLWGAGPKTQERLAASGVHCFGDLQKLEKTEIIRIVGEAAGQRFADLAFGRDERAVVNRRGPKSISHETTFSDDLRDAEACHAVLLRLSEAVGRRLRRQGYWGNILKLKLRYAPFETHSRQRRQSPATQDDLEIYRCARALFDELYEPGRPVRLLGVGAADLRDEAPELQTDLFEPVEKPNNKLNATLDAIKDRFGDRSIGHGLGQDSGSAFDGRIWQPIDEDGGDEDSPIPKT